jgi:pyridoxamine 5'-phosphate oxidase family protein
MSVFTPDEIEDLTSQTLAGMTTVGADGRPHVIPVTFTFNEEEDAIDVGGIAFAEGKKWRDARGNPNVTILVDDDRINPRFGNFTPEFLRIRPRRIVSWA